MDIYERIAKSVCDTEDTFKAALSIAMELNIRNQMEYLTSMFNVQALTRDEYIDEMSSLAVTLEDLADNVYGYSKKGADEYDL